jgi:hypothetical protein
VDFEANIGYIKKPVPLDFYELLNRFIVNERLIPLFSFTKRRKDRFLWIKSSNVLAVMQIIFK